jgi:hypothetical protein
VSIFCCHGDGRLDVRQTAARSSSQYRRGRSLLIRELTNGQPIINAPAFMASRDHYREASVLVDEVIK